MYGYGGDDNLSAGAGDDILDGGKGNDTLTGDAGNDTYKFGRGSGVDRVSNWASDYASTTDTVEFGAGITVNDLELVIDSAVGYNNLRINIKGSSDSLMIDNWFNGDAYKVDRFLFADGTELTAAQLEAKGCKVYGPYHNGSRGNDRMYGYLGDDTYKFGRGSGVDTIVNYARDYATTTDTVEFGAGITAADLKLVKYRDDLRINITGATDSLIMNNWFKGDAYKVDRFKFANGTVMTAAQLEAMGYETSNTIHGTPNDDYLTGSELDDQIIGYEGNDTMIGGAGDDSYIFNPGDGIDTIVDLASANEGNTVVFGQGITPNDLRLEVGSLIIRIGNNGDGVRFDNFDPDDAYGMHAVDRYEFADGTVLSYSELIGRGFDIAGTPENDQIRGTNVVDRITALEGNDAISSGAGDDIIFAGDGNDMLDGGRGADAMTGGTGDDTYIVDDAGDVVIESADEGTDTVQSSISYVLGVNIENLTLTGNDPIDGTGNERDNILAGNDAANTLTGGTGNDTLDGGEGDDRYIYNVGDGLDRLTDSSGMDTIALGQGIDRDHTIVHLDDSTARVRFLDAEYNETSYGIDITLSPDGSIPVETISLCRRYRYSYVRPYYWGKDHIRHERK